MFTSVRSVFFSRNTGSYLAEKDDNLCLGIILVTVNMIGERRTGISMQEQRGAAERKTIDARTDLHR